MDKSNTTKTIVLLLSILFTVTVNCGKKGPLVLVPALLPQAVADLKLDQNGANIRLRWTFPGFLSDQKTQADPANIQKIMIYYSDKEIPAEKFKKKSRLLEKCRPEDLERDQDYYVLSVPFKPKQLDGQTHYFSVVYVYGKKKSPPGSIGSIKTIIPIKPIADLQVTKEKKILKLTWSKPALNTAGTDAAGISGYNVYKKIRDKKGDGEKPAAFTRLNGRKILREYYEDADTGTDGEYDYYVTVVSSEIIESDPSNTATAAVTDVFPPEAPQNPVVFKYKDHLFLTWEKVRDADLSHYVVYKKTSLEEDVESKPVAKIRDNYYKDEDIVAKPGITYFYYITAVDEKGNESQASDIVKEKYQK